MNIKINPGNKWKGCDWGGLYRIFSICKFLFPKWVISKLVPIILSFVPVYLWSISNIQGGAIHIYISQIWIIYSRKAKEFAHNLITSEWELQSSLV